jgi:hypothetical protein
VGHGKWQEKFRRLILDAMARTRPPTVAPRSRTSGPVPRLPSGWHSDEYQKRMCHSCGLPTLGDVALQEGKWCGPCWTFRILPDRQARHPNDLPPAA